MDKPAIHHTNSDYRGNFFIKENGKTIASLTYQLEDGVMTIDHTEVQEVHEGHGLGSKLVQASFEFAKQHDYRVNPLCSFAEVVFDNHPEWSSVRI